MRLLQEVPHDRYKVYIYSWNNKYLIKIEDGMLEQTYKVSEWDVLGQDHLHEILNKLTADATIIFDHMKKHLSEAMDL